MLMSDDDRRTSPTGRHGPHQSCAIKALDLELENNMETNKLTHYVEA
jgi:hypothetical protein